MEQLPRCSTHGGSVRVSGLTPGLSSQVSQQHTLHLLQQSISDIVNDDSRDHDHNANDSVMQVRKV